MKIKHGLKLAVGAAFLLLGLSVIPHIVSENYTWLFGKISGLDPELGFFPRPLQNYSWTDRYGNVEEVSVNSLGFRGKELRADKSGKRIVLLGSSMVFGYGVRDSETISSYLENKFDPKRDPAEVINAGIKIYSVEQSYKLLRTRLLGLRPDYVVWFLTAENFSRDVDIQLSLYDYDAASDRLTEKSVKNSFFYRSSELVIGLRGHIGVRWFADFLFTFLNEMNTRLSATFRGDALERKFGKFTKEVADLAGRRRIKVALVILPDYFRSDLSYLQKYSVLPLIDLNRDPSFEVNRNALFLKGDYHLSSSGNQRVAEAVQRWIMR